MDAKGSEGVAEAQGEQPPSAPVEAPPAADGDERAAPERPPAESNGTDAPKEAEGNEDAAPTETGDSASQQPPAAEGGSSGANAASAEGDGGGDAPLERRRYSGAARKRFKWLMSKGYSQEEAREMALKNVRGSAPGQGVKRGSDEEPAAPLKKKRKPPGMLRKDRTFNMKPAVIKPPLGGIRLGIISTNYPDTLLSQEQIALLRDTVVDKLAPEKEGPFKPTFLGTSAKPGFIIFHCEDKATVLWLKTLVDKKLKGLVNEDLRALEQFQIPRKLVIVGYFPNKRRESINALFDIIKEQNEGLNVDAWVLHKLITIKGVTQAIIAVDHHSADKLIEYEFKINFKNRVVELKPDGNFQKNLDAPLCVPKVARDPGHFYPNLVWIRPNVPSVISSQGAYAPKVPQVPSVISSQGAYGPKTTEFPPAKKPFRQPMVAPVSTSRAPSWPGQNVGANPSPVDQTSMRGNAPACPVVPPPAPPTAQLTIPPSNFGSQLTSYNMNPGNRSRNETNTVPQNVQAAGQVNWNSSSQAPIYTAQTDQRIANNRYKWTKPVVQDEHQLISPHNANPKYSSGPESDRPSWTSPPEGHPTRDSTIDVGGSMWERRGGISSNPVSVNEVERPPRGMPGEHCSDRGSLTRADGTQRASKNSYLNRGPASEDESQVARRRHMSAHLDSSTEGDRRSRSRSRDRYSGREGCRSERRPRSRSRGHSGRRPLVEARGRLGDRPRDAIAERGSVADANGRPRRSPPSHYSERRSLTDGTRASYSNRESITDVEIHPYVRASDYALGGMRAEYDRHPRDTSRYPNRESVNEDERPLHGKSRDITYHGSEFNSDTGPSGTSRGGYLNRGTTNKVDESTSGIPRERYSNQGPTTDERQWTAAQDNYSNRGSVTEEIKPAWGPSQDSHLSCGPTIEANRPPRDVSGGRFANRWSTSEDGRPPSMSGERFVSHDSGYEANRPQGVTRDSALNNASVERHQNTVSTSYNRSLCVPKCADVATTADRSQWTSQSRYSNYGSATEDYIPSRNMSQEWYNDRDSILDKNDPLATPAKRDKWLIESDCLVFGEEHRGWATSVAEADRAPWGATGGGFLNRESGTKSEKPGLGSSRGNYSNHGSGTDLHGAGPTGATTQDVGLSNRASATVADARPLGVNATSRVSRGEVARPPWNTSRDSYPHRGSGTETNEPPRGGIQGTFSTLDSTVKKDDRQWDSSRDGFAGRNEVGRPPWATSRDGFSNREFSVDADSRPRAAQGVAFLNAGSTNAAARPAGRENSFRDVADAPYPTPKGASGGGFRSRVSEPQPPWSASRDALSRRESAGDADRRPGAASGDGSSSRGFPPAEPARPPWSTSRTDRFSNAPRPDQETREARNVSRENPSNFHVPDPRPSDRWTASREEAAARGDRWASTRDPLAASRWAAAGAGRSQAWRDRPHPGPDAGPVGGGGRFH